MDLVAEDMEMIVTHPTEQLTPTTLKPHIPHKQQTSLLALHDGPGRGCGPSVWGMGLFPASVH